MEKVIRTILKALPLAGAGLMAVAVGMAVRGGEMGQGPLLMAGLGFLFLLAMFIKLEAGRLGWYLRLAAMTVLLLADLTLVYLIAANHPVALDLTAGARLSLAPQTRTVLKNLKKKVEVVVYASRNEPFASYLDRFTAASDRFTYRIENPYKKTSAETKPGDQQQTASQVLVRCGSKEERFSLWGDKELEKDALERLDRKRKLERMLLNAVIKVTQDRQIRLYFTTGHGEKTIEPGTSGGQNAMRSYYDFAKMLYEQGMDVRQLDLRADLTIPEDCEVLVIAGPVLDFQESEVNALRNYLNQGKSLFALLDPAAAEQSLMPRLRALFAEYGAEVSDKFVADCGSYAVEQNYFVPVIRRFNPIHPVTENLTALGEALSMTAACAVRPTANPPQDMLFMELILSSEKSWEISLPQYQQIAREKKITLPPNSSFTKFPLAAALQPKAPVPGAPGQGLPRPRMVLAGDSDFLTNTQLGLVQKSFGLFSVLWLSRQSDLIDIPVKNVESTPLVLSPRERNLVFAFSVILLPMAVFFGGLAYTTIRRRTR